MLITKVFAVCPQCKNYQFAVSHLEPSSQPGTWMCEECGYYSQVTVSGTKEKPEYSIALTGERGYPITVTLATRTEPPVIFKLHEWKYGHSAEDSPEEFVEHQRYFYESHTCPTNCLSSTEKLIFNGDEDPHGLFELKAIEVGHVASDEKSDDAIELKAVKR